MLFWWARVEMEEAVLPEQRGLLAVAVAVAGQAHKHGL
jgi:hypothetical protein